MLIDLKGNQMSTDQKIFLTPSWAQFFSTKSSSIWCIIIAVCCQTALCYIFFTLDTDKLLQGLAAKSLVEGHGLTIAQVHVTDLSKPGYEKLNGWPPAYSLIVSPFLVLLNGNLSGACFTVAILFFIAFIVLLYRVLLFLQFPVYLINILLLFNGCSVTNYLQQSLATDLPAMFFCIWSCYLLAIYISNEKKAEYSGLVIGLVNAMASLFRYMYIGWSIVIPGLLIWNGWYKKDKRLLLGGFYSLAATIIITGAMLIFQHSYTGYWMYTKPTTHGFFLSNLQFIDPFILTIFINFDFYFVQLSSFLGVQYAKLQKIIRIAGLLPLAILLYTFIRYSIKTRLIAKSAKSSLLLAGGLTSLSILFILCYLSIRNSAYYDALPPFEWVYVAEGRYFISAQIMIAIFLTWWLFIRPVIRNRTMILLLRFVFLFLICTEIMHGGYLITKHLVIKNNPLPAPAFEKVKSIVAAIDKEAKQKNIQLVFTGNKEDYCEQISIKGINVLYKVNEINGPSIQSAAPTMMLVCLNNSVLSHFNAFFLRQKTYKIYQDKEFCLFTCYIESHINE